MNMQESRGVEFLNRNRANRLCSALHTPLRPHSATCGLRIRQQVISHAQWAKQLNLSQINIRETEVYVALEGGKFRIHLVNLFKQVELLYYIIIIELPSVQNYSTALLNRSVH